MLKGEELVRNCKETDEPLESKTCLRLNITKQICSSQGYIISKEDFIFDLNLEQRSYIDMHIEAMIMFHVEQLIKENWNHHNFEKLKKKRIIKQI